MKFPGKHARQLKERCRQRRARMLHGHVAWGATALSELAKHLLEVIQEHEHIGSFFKRLDDEERARVAFSLASLVDAAFVGIDLRMVCVNVQLARNHHQGIVEVLIEELCKPFPLGESALVVAVEGLFKNGDRVASWLESLKQSVHRGVRNIMQQVAIELLNGRGRTIKMEAISIWKEAISVRLEEDTMVWMLPLLPVQRLSESVELSDVELLGALLSDKLEDMIHSTSMYFEERCSQFTACSENTSMLLAASVHAWKACIDAKSHQRSLPIADGPLAEGDSHSTKRGHYINEQYFGLLSLEPGLVSAVQGALEQFTQAQGSAEMAAEAIQYWMTSKSGELRKLFTSPVAIQAPKFFAALRELVAFLSEPSFLKTRVELLSFQHLHVEVTLQLIAKFRDALIELFTLELAEKMSTEATQGFAALMNYVGGALIYTRVNSRNQIQLIQSSWATIAKG